MLLVLALGFSSGLPLGLSGAALQAWYTVDGINIATIGFLALVGQPYVYKFLWAPVMDSVVPAWGGRRRGWMLITQLLLAVTLVGMSRCTPTNSPLMLVFLALTLAFLSASQDIVLDAYRTEILTENERGTGVAWFVTGYRIAMLISGGLALSFAHYFGFKNTYLLMACFMAIGLLATLLSKEPKIYEKPPPNFLSACVLPFKQFLSRKNAFALLALVVLYKLGDACAGSLTTAFLLRGVGFSLVDVGLINKTVGFGATLLGIFLAGMMLSKIGLFRALLWFGLIQAVTNLTYLVLAILGQNYAVMIGAVFLENLGGGMGTAAFVAFLMSLCDARYTATQFALLSALSAVGRVFVGPVAGVLVAKLGWSEFFVWTLVFSVPGLILLWALRSTIDKVKTKDEEPDAKPQTAS